MKARPPRPEAAIALDAFSRRYAGGRAQRSSAGRALPALLLVPALSMCGGPPEAPQPAPPPADAIEVVRAPEPDTTLAGEVGRAEFFLGEADLHLRQGRLELATENYQRVLGLQRADAAEFPRDIRARALWGTAVTRLLALDPEGDTTLTMSVLETLVTSYDGTVEAAQARLAVAMLKEIEKLRAQSVRKDEDIRRLNETMEQLKRIDLSRRPSGDLEL